MNFRSKKCDFNVDTIQKVVYTIDSVEQTLKEWRCVRLNRTLMKDLVSWKSKRNRKPLILQGTRQVGKTWIMKEFGRRNDKYVAI